MSGRKYVTAGMKTIARGKAGVSALPSGTVPVPAPAAWMTIRPSLPRLRKVTTQFPALVTATAFSVSSRSTARWGNCGKTSMLSPVREFPERSVTNDGLNSNEISDVSRFASFRATGFWMAASVRVSDR